MNQAIKNNFQGKKVLVVDDEPSLLQLLDLRLRSLGLDIKKAESAEEAVALLPSYRPQLVITDLKMGKMDGMALFSHIQQQYPALPVIILTAHGTIKEAVAATHQGVFGFLTKPFVKEELIALVTKAFELNTRVDHVQDIDGIAAWRANIITRSAMMENLLDEVERVAQTNVSVYIQGESGTGKELIAQAIHKAGSRRDKQFVAVNCSAIPEDLLESELFGHQKGAFSGASAARKGLFEIADGGTLFLDEIGDMSPAFQVKLLRALQEGEIRPVGANKTIAVDVRVISASHRDLQEMTTNNLFRLDLYYRLNVVTLMLPRLAERLEDIPLLASYFLTNNDTQIEAVVKGFSNEAMELLIAYDWPGNVRQLKNVIEHICTFATTPLVPVNLVEKALREKQKLSLSFNEAKKNFERDYLVKLLQLANGSVTEAARLAKRNRTEFYRLLDRHNLKAAEFKNK
ncbi:MAG: sigma 54-interacting transcriptional regulator [Methyloprofundus sp.]|nr:sigma 54-interacting transcriptional regulator [Methyloprofundus sp.]MDT8424474.1 sigma 54-interacting transcriptional regulator [Methyloprofundus sp.]